METNKLVQIFNACKTTEAALAAKDAYMAGLEEGQKAGRLPDSIYRHVGLSDVTTADLARAYSFGVLDCLYRQCSPEDRAKSIRASVDKLAKAAGITNDETGGDSE